MNIFQTLFSLISQMKEKRTTEKSIGPINIGSSLRVESMLSGSKNKTHSYSNLSTN